ncbi:MAG: hypothetical protein LBR68_05385, partial [Lachnoclostridium sp.]|nr:hypothetical protein [Lachnoclostridium sp.]
MKKKSTKNILVVLICLSNFLYLISIAIYAKTNNTIASESENQKTTVILNYKDVDTKAIVKTDYITDVTAGETIEYEASLPESSFKFNRDGDDDYEQYLYSSITINIPVHS